jgi:hypothetical protein
LPRPWSSRPADDLDDLLDGDHMRRMVSLFMDVHDIVRGYCIPCSISRPWTAEQRQWLEQLADDDSDD